MNQVETVLITGGTSDIAQPLIEKIINSTYFNIVITKNNSDFYKNPRITEVKVDFSDSLQIDDFLEQIENINIKYFIQLHGTAVLNDNIMLLTSQDLLYTLNVNFLSVNKIISNLLVKMQKNCFGRITLVGTASTKFGGGENSFSYGLSKHSMNYLVKHLAKYYSKYGILTNLVSPGFIKTKFHTNTMKRDNQFLQERGKMIKVGYAGTPEDVSDLIYYLTFNNNFVCGENVKIDGADFI